MRRLLRASILIALVSQIARAQVSAAPGLTTDDRVRIAEAFRIAETLGDAIWPGWSRIPLATLFVTNDREYLIRHPNPSSDFTKAGYDSLLGSDGARLAYAAYRHSRAEAVICISNKKLTWAVVHNLERRGIPAYGAIWDS